MWQALSRNLTLARAEQLVSHLAVTYICGGSDLKTDAKNSQCTGIKRCLLDLLELNMTPVTGTTATTHVVDQPTAQLAHLMHT